MTIANVLAFGFVPALFTTGRFLQSKLFDTEPRSTDLLSKWTIAITMGLALWLPIMIGLAWLGLFNAAAIGAIGWASVILYATIRRKPAVEHFGKVESLALAIAILTAVWNIAYATESLAGGRDQGVYSNHGVVIAKTGSIYPEKFFEKMFDGEYHHLIRGNQSGGLYFRYRPHIIVQFPPSFATLLAQGYGIAGHRGLFSINPILSSLCGLLFFSVLRRFVPPMWAVAGLLFFSLNVVQFWNARITLSEILAQAYLLGGLAILIAAWKENSKVGFAFGVFAICLNAGVRVDGFLAVAGLGAGFCAIRWAGLVEKGPSRISLIKWGAISGMIFSVLNLAYVAYSTPGYFESLSSRIIPISIGSAILCCLSLIPLPTRFTNFLRKATTSPALLYSLAAVLISVAIYAYFLRPSHEPFAVLPPEHPNAGERDFRENALPDLAAYLSPLTLIFAFLGLVALVKRNQELDILPLLLLSSLSAFALLYLYNPSISPDHIWKMRRFTPAVIPLLILLAVVGSHSLCSKIPNHVLRKAAGYALALALYFQLVTTGRALAFEKLNAGLSEFSESIAGEIPDDAIVITDVPMSLLAPMQFARPYQVIRGHPNYPPHREYIPKLANELQQVGENVLFLSQNGTLVKELEDRYPTKTLRVKTIDPSPHPFPIQIREETFKVSLSKWNNQQIGYDRSLKSITFGYAPILGIEESGMYPVEFSGEVPFRWTHETAYFNLPWIFESKPLSSRIKIGGCKPGGSAFNVKMNGQTVFAGNVDTSTQWLELDTTLSDWTRPTLEIELKSEGWKPSDAYPSSTDTRELGVRLIAIEIRMEKDAVESPISFGSRTHHLIKESGLHDTESIGSETFRWTNGEAEFEFYIDQSYTPQALYLSLAPRAVPMGRLEVFWNDIELVKWDKDTFGTETSISIPPQLGSNRKVVLRIKSDFFVPSEFDPKSTDNRRLGVAIQRISLE